MCSCANLAVDANAAETIFDCANGHADGRLLIGRHVVKDGELRTPEHSQEILPGTTRSVVEELAARAGVVHRAAP